MMEKTLNICPRCQTRYVREAHSGDFEHICTGAEALRNEDVFVLGDWQDYTGSDFNVNNTFLQGAENKLFGTRSAIEGQRESDYTSRGFPTDKFRTRQHIESINESTFKQEQPVDTQPEQYDGN